MEEEVVVMHERRKLPNNVQIEQIATAVLREAPFVVGGNAAKVFWQKQLTSDEFQHLTTDGYWWLLAYDVQKQHKKTKTAARYANSEKEVLEDPIFGRMAGSFVTMFNRVPSSKKDIFFGHFYEAMAYALLLALIQGHPKQRTYFDDIDFRKRLVDRCSVWTTGLRPHSLAAESWIIKANIASTSHIRGTGGHNSAFNASASINSRSPTKSHRAFGASLTSGSRGRGARKEDLPVTMTVRSRHELTTSPFVQRWMEENGVRMPTGLGLKVGLTQDGYRPVLYKPRHSSFGHDALSGTAMRDCDEGTWRNLIPTGTLAQRTRALEAEAKTSDFLAECDSARSGIMAKYAESKAQAVKDEMRAHRNIKALEMKYDEQAEEMLMSEELREYSNHVMAGIQDRQNKTTRSTHTGR
mmetsp:Transcript_28230/g.76332  ORF Transcript_28230/g.76332 Transcript_28230/m.76332 type:complete len:411 (-) Transcript_28230:151-1383(-)